MSRFRSLLIVVALALLAGCGTFSFNRDPSAQWDADRFLAEARSELQIANYQRAREHLQKLEARFPFTRHAQQAQMEIAYSYYKEGESAQALSTIERFIKVNPNHPNVDYMVYLRGLASFNDDLGMLGRYIGQDPTMRDPKAMREAFDAFRELVTRYPESRYAPDSRDRMNWLIDAIARSEVHVARFYLQRGAYLAAIQRAQSTVRDFGGAPASEEALAILSAAYKRLELTDMSADIERVLALNFPASRYLKQPIVVQR